MKITVDCAGVGLDGAQVAEILRQNAVECELCGRDVVVLMFSPSTDEDAFLRVKTALLSQTVGESTNREFPQMAVPTKAMSIREALFAEQETVKVQNAIGRVCAAP